MVEANHIEPVEEDYSEIKISKKEEKKILDLAADTKLFPKLISSIAPSIYGYEELKEALLLQLVGGVRKTKEDGTRIRGDMHILLVGDPGSGKCVSENTKIILEDGEIISIKSFNNNKFSQNTSSNMKVLSINENGLNFASRPTRFWKRKSPRYLLKIVTNTGNELVITKEHPLFTTNNGLIFAKKAQEYRVGDFIALPSKIDVKGSLQTITTNVSPSRSNNKVKYKIKKMFDAEFARLFGYLVGDGYVRFRKTTGIISFTNNNKKLLNDFENLIKKVFNLKVSKRKKQDSNSYEYYISSIELVRILEKIDPNIVKSSGNMNIGKIICKSPNYILKEFLKSLFDCEGYVNKDKKEIEFSSKSKELAYDIKYILLRFGIISQISSALKYAANTKKKTKRTYYRLRIGGEDSIKFYEKIGFVSKEKQTQLRLKSKEKRLNTNINIIPNLKNLLLTLRKKYRLTQFDFPIKRSTYQHYEKGDRSPSYAKLKEICKKYNQLKVKDPLIEILNQISKADVFWDKIKSIETIKSKEEYVYDLEIKDVHNFVANGVMVHNSQLLKRISIVAPKARYVGGKGASGAGLTATVVRDEFLRGWALEAGALVLTNKGICCTTEDTEFITEDHKKITFKELFDKTNKKFLYPKFKVFALNKENNKIELFKIKRAFKIRNDKPICQIKTRTGRKIKLTEDNEVLTIRNSEEKWVRIKDIKKGEYIAVPSRYSLEGKEGYTKTFSYICGLIASDGSIKINNKNAQTSFYNTDRQLINIYKKCLDKTGINHNTHITKSGRKSIINGKEIVSKKKLFKVYNCRKNFAKRIIDFGIPNGNKSIKKQLGKRIFAYSNKTISSLMRGVFDGDGSIRKNPYEITITTGIKENALLFQSILLRLGIISSVKKSTNSWHCDIRGVDECLKFFYLVGSSHPLKFNKLSEIQTKEVKDRLNILPNHQEFFKQIIKDYRGQLGKKVYKYIWNYAKKGVQPSKNKLKKLNRLIQDEVLEKKINDDILWDKIISIKKTNEEYVYDFTMEDTNNFVANDIIMHNCIDELDKMTSEDRDAMHEALEQQTVSISKANIQATLRSETTVLAAANPKFGRFDPYEMIAKQIDLPSTLINRFDLIFPIRDLPDKDRDEKMAKFILNLHQSDISQESEIPTEFLRKYLSYSKQKIFPKLTDSALEEIKEFFVKMRNAGVTEGEIRAIPVSARQLEALVRLAEASARLRLSDKVLKKDARRAIDLLKYCLNMIGIDPETGKIDIDVITTGISSSERSHISQIREIILNLEETIGKVIPLSDIIAEAKEKNLDESRVEEIVERLKRSGDIFEPKRNFIQRI